MSALPPGPELPAAVQTVALARDPIGVLSRCRSRYGPVFSLDLRFAGPTVVVGDHDLAAPLVEGDGVIAHAGAARRRVLPQSSPGSSFGADEERHRRLRARIAPALATERLEAQRDGIGEVAARQIEAWPDRGPILLLSRMRSIAEEVFIRHVLGVVSDNRAARIAATIGRVLRTGANPPLTPPDRDHPLGKAVDAVLRWRLRPLVEPIDLALRERRHVDPHGDSILDVLAADPTVSVEEAIDELLVVMAAAQEPAAIAMTWLMMELSRDDRLRVRFCAAAPGSDSRRAIVYEVIRLYPPGLAALRVLTEEREIGGHRLPAGTGVMVAIPLVHRDLRRFPDPLRLEPGRFAGRDRPAAFMPFGGGPRRCPGEALARLELDVVVPAVLDRVELRFPRRHERPVQRATVLPPNRSGLAWV